MNQENLKFDDIYHLEAVMRIFGKTAQTSIMGSEPSRMRNRYGWHVYNIHQKIIFWRREIQATALILDGLEAKRLPSPYTTAAWSAWVRSSLPDEKFVALLKAVESAPLPNYERALIESAKLEEQWPRDRLITDFWTVDQMAESIGISRESVYKRSDIRLGDDRGLRTVSFGGISLWYPLIVPDPATVTG